MTDTIEDLSRQRDALVQQLAEIEKIIAEQKLAHRQEAIQAIHDLLGKHGLTLDDLREKQPAETRAPVRKVAPKYRDPATGTTWTGRGVKPRWIKEALAAGRNASDFAIRPDAA
jgi:DNA-binding protein H-NS